MVSKRCKLIKIKVLRDRCDSLTHSGSQVSPLSLIDQTAKPEAQKIGTILFILFLVTFIANWTFEPIIRLSISNGLSVQWLINGRSVFLSKLEHEIILSITLFIKVFYHKKLTRNTKKDYYIYKDRDNVKHYSVKQNNHFAFNLLN